MSADGNVGAGNIVLPAYRMGPPPPPDWVAECIYHRKITFDVQHGQMNYWYSYGKMIKSGDIDTYLDSILDPAPPPVVLQLKNASELIAIKASQATLFDVQISTSLDFAVYAPAYVLIELDGSRDWFFRTDRDPVSTDQPLDTDYCGLTYVFADGSREPAGMPVPQPLAIPAGCRFVFFAVTGPLQPWPAQVRQDKFNINVGYVQSDGGVIWDDVDPDITNPGGPPHN